MVPVDSFRRLSRNRERMNEISPETHAPPAAAPVSDGERLKLIDALRGVAVLGILLMNIPGFAMPDYFSDRSTVQYSAACVC
jgi:uncharacterized membrane protein YeiB